MTGILGKIGSGLEDPSAILPYISRRLYRKFVTPLPIFTTSRFDIGYNIFEDDWDLLIILDTCRPDALRIVANEYDFIDKVDERWSVGASSGEWIANTFDKRHSEAIQNTAYLTSNPHAKTVLEYQLEKNYNGDPLGNERGKGLKKFGNFDIVPADQLGMYENLCTTSVDHDHATYPSPRRLTDRAIHIDRTADHDRILLHYMPPHRPYLASVGDDGTVELQEKERSETYTAYLDNLRWALSEVSLLLDNMNRERAIITADHGESFSNYLPGHIGGAIHKTTRKVPWVTTEAHDSNTYQPENSEKESHYSPEQMLEALGYKT